MTSPLATAAFEAKSPRRRRFEAGHAIEARCEADEAPAFTAPTREPAAARAIPAAFASKGLSLGEQIPAATATQARHVRLGGTGRTGELPDRIFALLMDVVPRTVAEICEAVATDGVTRK